MVSVNSTDGDSRCDNVLVEIGSLLRKARSAQNVSYEDASRTVRIRPDFLRSLEAGQLDGLPERVYVRGFIKAYGNYLGLDGDTLANQFASAAELVPSPHQHKRRAPVGVQLRPIHAWIAYVVLIVGAVGGIAVFMDRNGTFELAGSSPQDSIRDDGLIDRDDLYRQESLDLALSSASTEEVFPTLQDWTYIEGVFPSRDDSLIATATPEEVLEGLIVGIQVVDAASWVRVVADRETVFEGTLQPGFEQQWEADESLILRAGNAGGVLVTLNNEDVGRMGGAGEVREQQFTLVAEGEIEVR
ncbi:MAG: RodZ domain-containing protein [Cyanobacteria bacterium P01_E01_bin.34]